MIDFSKIYCRHHPGETVINFCTQSTILFLFQAIAARGCVLPAYANTLKNI